MEPGLQTVFQMRYSFFGKSGWRSAPSKDKARLLDPARLRKRFHYFENMALPSLAAQSDQNFTLLLLTSEDLPDAHKTVLEDVCYDTLGKDRCRILYRPPDGAGRWFQRYMRKRMNRVSHSIQIVLDDDDAVAADFVETTRREAEFVLPGFREDQECIYLSYASGLTADFGKDGVRLLQREVPFTNLGLSLVAPTKTRKNPYMLAHKKVSRRHPVRVNYDLRPFYIRSVHDSNDSRTHMGDDRIEETALPGLLRYFPWLDELNLLWPDAESAGDREQERGRDQTKVA